MHLAQNESLEESRGWSAYRAAFEVLRRSAERIRYLTDDSSPDRADVATALLDLEKARLNYNDCRDALARELFPLPAKGEASPPGSSFSGAVSARTKAIAELLWQTAGKPEGTAEQDWLRAEEILRRAAAA